MEPFSIYTVGDWNIADSYGKIAIELARYLTGQAVRVNCISLGETITPGQPADVQAITAQPIVPTLGGLAMGWPSHFPKLGTMFHAGPKMALTMFESSKLPASWHDALAGFDAIITPSHFCAQVFVDAGIDAPIFIVPLGVSPIYRFSSRPLTFSAERPMTFLAFLDRGERKGGLTAIQAFLRAFGDDPTRKLVLKGRKPKQEFTLTNPNIEVILEDYDELAMAALYSRCDVLINAHKGEGFGLIPREFAATGGLALTTNWSGTVDGLPFWGVPIPYTLERALWTGNKGLEGQDLGEWAKVDAEALAYLLLDVAYAWSYQHSLLSKRAAFVCERYSWQRFGEQVWGVWKEITDGHHLVDRQPAAAGGYGIVAG